MTQTAVLLADYALLSPSVSFMSSSPSASYSSSSSTSSSFSSSSPISSSTCADMSELTDPTSCMSPCSSSSYSPSASLFLPPAKSTRSSLLHKRSSSTASTASTASLNSTSTSTSSSGSPTSSYPPSPLPGTPPSMVDVLPPSPSRLRIDSGMVGLVQHFDALHHAAVLSPSSNVSTAQKPPLSPSSGTGTRRSRVNRALSQQPVMPSPTSKPTASRRKRLLQQPSSHIASPPQCANQLPSQPSLQYAATSLPPLATRSLSIPAHFRATSASSTLPQFPFRSIAHDVLSTGSPVSSPCMSAGPSRSPSPSTSPLHSARRSSFSFHPLSPAHSLSHYSSSPGASFFPPSISASPILLPQPNFDVPPPSPPPLASSPHPSSSPSPTPSPPDSPSCRWQGRGKLPLSGKTADGVAMVSCATVAELLRGRNESRRRKQQMEDEKQTHHEAGIASDTDTSSPPSSFSGASSPSSSSACSTPSPPPGILAPFSTLFDDVMIFDCRFAYEYDGGHIPNAINVTSFQQLQDILFSVTTTVEGGAESGSGATASSRTCLVFHCEFSQSRAPQYFSSLRRLNESSLASYNTANSSSTTAPLCPTQLLSSCPYPDMYVMEGGYRRWVEEYADLCEPAGGYVEMRDRRWREECGKGLKERKQEKKGEMERKRRRQQHGPSATVDDDCMRRITRSSTAAASLTVGGVGGGSSAAVDFNMVSPAFRRTSSCSSLLSAYSPIPLSLHEADGGNSAEKEERRCKREKR